MNNRVRDGNTAEKDGTTGVVGYVLMGFSLLIVIVFFPFSLMCTLKVVQEYERAVIFRLGRVVSSKPIGPGIVFLFPCIDSLKSVDLRTMSYEIQPQNIISKDSATITVAAVVQAHILAQTRVIASIQNAPVVIKRLAATTVQHVLGTKTLAEILSDRKQISSAIKKHLDNATRRRGIRLERVELKDIKLPQLMQRSMAAEAESARMAQAKVIAADGELNASHSLKEAATIMSQSPSTIQLRYLQTMQSISATKNKTIVFALPKDLLFQLINRR